MLTRIIHIIFDRIHPVAVPEQIHSTSQQEKNFDTQNHGIQTGQNILWLENLFPVIYAIKIVTPRASLE